MEDIFKKDKFKHIVIEISIAKELEKLDKGSYNKAIKHLLNINDNKLIDQIKENSSDISEIQDKLIKIVQNRLGA